jgi:hypothetical protein
VQIFVNRQLLGVVIAHRQAGGVAAGDVAVLLALPDVDTRVTAREQRVH